LYSCPDFEISRSLTLKNHSKTTKKKDKKGRTKEKEK
jgi:hypothetical protein